MSEPETGSGNETESVVKNMSVTKRSNTQESNTPESNTNNNKKSVSSITNSSSQEKNQTETKAENKMTVADLNNEINDTINKLKEKLGEADFSGLTDGLSIEKVCDEISKQNLLGEFDKELYKSLNKFFDDSYSTINVGPQGNIPLRVRGNFSQLVYSKIINGKMDDPLWPSDQQKEMFKDSLKTSMSSRFMGMFSKGKNNNSEGSKKESSEGNNNPNKQGNNSASNPNTEGAVVKQGSSKGGKKLIVKRKRKYIRKN